MKTAKFIVIIAGFLLFFLAAFLLFYPSNDPTGLFVYTPNLAIVNAQNTEPVGGNLKIEFMTIGSNDLTVYASEGEMELIELVCKNQLTAHVSGEKWVYRDYSCEDNGYVAVKPMSNVLSVVVQFGNTKQLAQNIAP